jgi:cytochrome c oxidase subunit 4
MITKSGSASVAPRHLSLGFAALIGLTAATVALCRVNLGAWHGAVGLSIAGIKAALIVLFFMGVWRSSRLTWVIALSGVFWLGLLVGLTMSDVVTRNWPM